MFLPRRAAVHNAVDGSMICSGCEQFIDCAIKDETRVYLLSEPTQ